MKFFSLLTIVSLAAIAAAYPQPLEERQLGGSVCIDTSSIPEPLSGIVSEISGLLSGTGTDLLTIADPCPAGCSPALSDDLVDSIIDNIPMIGDVISGLVDELPLSAVNVSTGLSSHVELVLTKIFLCRLDLHLRLDSLCAIRRKTALSDLINYCTSKYVFCLFVSWTGDFVGFDAGHMSRAFACCMLLKCV